MQNMQKYAKNMQKICKKYVKYAAQYANKNAQYALNMQKNICKKMLNKQNNMQSWFIANYAKYAKNAAECAKKSE